MPARFRAWLILLVVFSVLDAVQVALTSGSSLPGPRSGHEPIIGQYVNLRLLLPWGGSDIGTADLLLAAEIGEFWRRAGAAVWIAPLAAVIGLGLADLFVAVTGVRGLPLVPFLTFGWLMVAGGREMSLATSVAKPKDS